MVCQFLDVHPIIPPESRPTVEHNERLATALPDVVKFDVIAAWIPGGYREVFEVFGMKDFAAVECVTAVRRQLFPLSTIEIPISRHAIRRRNLCRRSGLAN